MRGNGEARADGEIDQQREHEREARMDARGKRLQTARPRDRDNAHDRHADGADREAEKRQPCVRAGLRPEKRRKNQVSRAEKHGKQSKAYENKTFSVKFV